MSKQTKWVLTDVDQDIYVKKFELDAKSAPGKLPGGWKITKRRLRGGLRDGVDIIEVDNGALSYVIVPTRGMGLYKGSYHNLPIGWDAPPRGPVNPMFVNPLTDGGLGWLKGFDEWVVRCGLVSNGPPCTDIVPDNNGNPAEVSLCLHGNIANTPAHYVAVSIEKDADGNPLLVVEGKVEEAMLFFPQLELTTRIETPLEGNWVRVIDEVKNVKQVPGEVSLLYHCNYGAPFLCEGAKLVAPSREVAPRDPRACEGLADYESYPAPTAGFVEQCYWHELATDAEGHTLAMLQNAQADKAVVVRWNKNELPCFTQWKNPVGEREGYVTGLEPGTNFPNPKTFEREKGRIPTLQPDEVLRAELVFEVHDTAAGVAAIQAEIKALMGKKKTKVHKSMVAKWTPGA
jgi:hypothetical protein